MGLRGVLTVIAGLALGGCVQSTLEPASDTNLKPRDRQLLASAPYAKASIPDHYQRHIVGYHRREAPGTIVIDSDARYLFFVLPEGKAIRYGVTVGEEALAFSGIAKVGRKEEWPSWTPTAETKKRAWSAQSDGSARSLSLCRQQGHAVPRARHQSARTYWLRHLVRLHPHDQ
jgi:lipoprotein-anchoring transpeptidase ErfK/SrfK